MDTKAQRLPGARIVAGYDDGWAGSATLGYSWPGAMKKARATEAIVRRQLAELKLQYDEIHTEFLGFNSLLGPLADDSRIEELNEVYLKMSVRAKPSMSRPTGSPRK